METNHHAFEAGQEVSAATDTGKTDIRHNGTAPQKSCLRLLLAVEQLADRASLRSALARQEIDILDVSLERIPEPGTLESLSVAVVSAGAPGLRFQLVVRTIKYRFGVPVLCLLPLPPSEQIADTAQLQADALVFAPVRPRTLRSRA